MSNPIATLPTPRQIIAALLPHLKVAAAYAQEIQSRIAEQPEKDYPDNPFASALTDADLSIQTFVEVLLLGYFPQLRFFGEEHEKSFNTKYFRSITLGPQGDYLVTLDPIDGTRFYADGHPYYQIILNVLNGDGFEAVLLINPAQDQYFYALRGEGTFRGRLTEALEDCQPHRIIPQQNAIYLGGGMGAAGAKLAGQYEIYDLHEMYSAEAAMPNTAGLLNGTFAGAVLAGAQFIDGAAIAFLAQEAGCIVTTHDGNPPPPLKDCPSFVWPGIVVATSEAVHRDLLQAVQS